MHKPLALQTFVSYIDNIDSTHPETDMHYAAFITDLATDCVVEVKAAASSYYDSVRGLTVRQTFFVYPDDTVVCVSCCDGTTTVARLDDDDQATFHHLYLRAAQAA